MVWETSGQNGVNHLTVLLCYSNDPIHVSFVTLANGEVVISH